MSTTAQSQSQIKKQLKLDGNSDGVVLFNGERIGRYRTEKGAGGNAVLIADLAKEFVGGKEIRGGNKDTLVASLAKEMYRTAKQEPTYA